MDVGAQRLSFNISIDYAGASGRLSNRVVTVRRLGLDDLVPAVSGICHERRAPRTFRIDRIFNLTDPRTGVSVTDILPWLRQRAAEPPEGGLPQGGVRRRIISPLQFVEGRVAGWTFGVPEAFKPALDVAVTRHILSARAGGIAKQLKQMDPGLDFEALMIDGGARRGFAVHLIERGHAVQALQVELMEDRRVLALYIETQGQPPMFDFSVGDIFYAPAGTERSGTPGHGSRAAEILQVVAMAGEDLKVEHRVLNADGYKRIDVLDCAQEDLADLLEFGVQLR